MNDNKIGRLSGGFQTVGQTKSEFRQLSESQKIHERYTRERDMSKVTMLPPTKPDKNLFSNHAKKRVVVYCRVSTDGLSQQTSFELQKAYYVKYINEHPDWELVAVYGDEGITATQIDGREGLKTMLTDARAGMFDIIIVKNLSRLNRNLKDCIDIIEELRKLPNPVGVYFENEKLFTLDKSNDFTLSVLSLVAQEESHKKSEAMLGSYFMRFSQGNYMKPDLLGYDKADVNEIIVNPEEAKTVQLIFMMYLAGFDAAVIAKVLTLLGRKTHTHVCKDGHITGGIVKWSRSSVLNVMRNERRMGAVLAQKTITPDFKDHKSIPNDGRLPQFWAVDQHEAIINEQDFRTAERIMRANYGGWKDGLQTLRVHDSGALAGFVSVCPGWRGFDSEDYNRAALRANGICEEDLDDYEILLQKKIKEGNAAKKAESENLQHRIYVNPGDFDMFKMDEQVETEEEEEEPLPDFKMWIDSIREQKNRTVDKLAFGKYDLSGAEVIRPEFLSATDKPSITLDVRGITFNRSCEKKLNEGFVENIEIYYHPIEQILLVRKAEKETPATLRWAKEKDGVTTMRHCGCPGITECIYNNMKWVSEYKYRIVGTRMMIAGETMLVFALDKHQMIVPAVPDSVQDIDTNTLSKNVTKNLLRDGFTLESELPDLDDFELGNGPMATAAKKMSRSRAIYFDKMLQDNNGSVSVEKMGEKKYDPECIQHLIEKGITPDEGWVYLKGMAVFRKSSFTIFPSEWSESFGNKFYENAGCRIQDAQRRIQFEPIEEGIEYGWPLGLDLPTEEVVLSAIAELLQETDNQEQQWTAESLLKAALS